MSEKESALKSAKEPRVRAAETAGADRDRKAEVSKGSEETAAVTRRTPLWAPSGPGHPFNLTVNRPGDPLEEEAERAAESIERPESSGGGSPAAGQPWKGVPAPVRGDETKFARRLRRRLDRTQNSGNALPPETRRDFEGRMAQDLGAVRVHADSEAARLNETLQARAFTHGQHIYFATGQYNPHSGRGRRLLAHELAHVRQQEETSRRLAPDIQRQATEEAETETQPRTIVVPWRGSVLVSLLYYFRPLTSITDEELVSGIQAALEDAGERFYFTDRNPETGEAVNYSNLSQQRFEQLMREHQRTTFTLQPEVADLVLPNLELTWESFEARSRIRSELEELEPLTHLDLGEILTAPPAEPPAPTEVQYSAEATQEDISLVQRFIEEVFNGEPPAPAETGGYLFISMAEIEAVRAFYQAPEEERQALLELLRPTAEGDAREGPEDLDTLIETAQAYQRIQQTKELFGEEIEAASDTGQPPIVPRPVHGRIATPDTAITTGMEAQFYFITEDNVDAFRVPHVTIRWLALRRREDGPIEQIESDTTSYIEVREQGLLNDRIFEVEFEHPGTYEIHAIVDHNFFLPNAFQTEVTVQPPTEVIDQLQREAAGDFGELGRRTSESDYLFAEITDIGSYAEGYRYYGELSEERFAAGMGSFQESYAAIDHDISTLEELIEHYRTAERELGQDNQDLIGWAEGRLSRLRETRDQLGEFERGEDSLPVAVLGMFASQTSGVEHRQLELVAWFDYSINEQGEAEYTGHLLDHSGVTGPENLHFTRTEGSYEEMVEGLFLELSEDYPSGYMSVSFQIYDREQRTRRVVTFERRTNTLSGDIAAAAFSTPVSIAVNVTAAILTVFPPTTGLGIAISLTYNAAATAYDISQAIESDTLRASHAVDVGLLFLDILPVIGKGIHGFVTAGRIVQTVETASGIYRVLSVAGNITEYAGELYMFSAEAERQIRQLHDQQIVELAGVIERMQTLQAQGAPQQVVAIEQQRAENLQQQIRETLVDTLTTLAATQAISIATPAAVGRLAAAHPRARGEGATGPARPGGEAEPGVRERGPEERPAEPESRAPQPVETGGDPNALPERLLSAGSLIPVQRNPQLPGHEVRVYYDADERGLVTRIWVEAGPDAARLHLEQHAATIRLLQRYQGLSGRLRVFLTRMQNIINHYTQVTGHIPLPGSSAFEAEAEILKLPGIIRQRAEQLANPRLSALERAEIMAEIDQLEGDLQRHMDTFEQMDLEIGAGYIAARHEPRSNQAAIDAGYPSLDQAPGHYYVRSPAGGFYLRRFADSNDPPKQVVRENGVWVIRDREPGSVIHEPPESLQPGETRTYTGPHGDTATATRRIHDRAIVIRSQIGPGPGRLGYEHAMFAGVEVGLEGWQRAHSQGQGTGHESPFGILYAPEEVNQRYQRLGIEQHIRDLFSQVDPNVTLVLTTETIAHPGTQRLESITYRIEAQRADGSTVPLYEAEIRVEDRRDDPEVGISASQHAEVEQFLVPAPGRQPGTRPADSPEPASDPLIGPHEEPVVRAIDALDGLESRLEAHPDLAIYRQEVEQARQRLRENPSEETIENAQQLIQDIEEVLEQY